MAPPSGGCVLGHTRRCGCHPPARQGVGTFPLSPLITRRCFKFVALMQRPAFWSLITHSLSSLATAPLVSPPVLDQGGKGHALSLADHPLSSSPVGPPILSDPSVTMVFYLGFLPNHSSTTKNASLTELSLCRRGGRQDPQTPSCLTARRN